LLFELLLVAGLVGFSLDAFFGRYSCVTLSYAITDYAVADKMAFSGFFELKFEFHCQPCR